MGRFHETAIALSVAAILGTPMAGIGGTLGDHFMDYRAKPQEGTDPFASFGPVVLTDQFGRGKYQVVKPRDLFVPANKNDEGILDPDTHLEEYRLRPVRGAPAFERLRDVRIVNQCNDMLLEVIKPLSLLVPTSKGLSDLLPPPDPATHLVDHFLCYKAKRQGKLADGTKLPKFPKGMQVEVADQFHLEKQTYDLKRVTRLCNPVSKQEDPEMPPTILSGPEKGQPKPIEPADVRNPGDHLVCYRAVLAKKRIPQLGCGCDVSVDPKCRGDEIEPAQDKHVERRVFLNNQFGPEKRQTVKEVELCIPAEKTAPPVRPFCGDGVVNQPSEQCDPPDDAACPGLCRLDCRCGIEVDDFPDTSATVDIDTPLGSETVRLRGPTLVHVDLGSMREEAGRDIVDTEMVSMSLTGHSSLLGAVTVNAGSSFGLTPTLGTIHENVNDTPGVLDLEPFVAGPNTANSFFDVFFEVKLELPPPLDRLHNVDPKRMSSVITHKPPAGGDTYSGPTVITLFDDDGNPVGTMGVAAHVPRPVECGDTFPACDGACPNPDEACESKGDRCECAPSLPPDSCVCGENCDLICPDGTSVTGQCVVADASLPPGECRCAAICPDLPPLCNPIGPFECTQSTCELTCPDGEVVPGLCDVPDPGGCLCSNLRTGTPCGGVAGTLD